MLLFIDIINVKPKNISPRGFNILAVQASYPITSSLFPSQTHPQSHSTNREYGHI
jgi:hypothetical protein